MTAQQIADATAAAKAAGIDNPTQADIVAFAQDPLADEVSEEGKLPPSVVPIDAATVQSDLQAMIDEAKANSTSAQVIDFLTKFEAVAMPLVSKLTGIPI